MSTQTFSHTFARSALAVILSAAFISPVLAGDREQAKRIHDRLVGTPPSDLCLTQLQTQVTAGNANAAAMDAITDSGGGDNCTGKDFYRVTLKNFITPWTNEEQTVFAPLNDYSATVIGIIRDELDFRKILHADLLYTGASPSNLASSNAHYKALEDSGADLSNTAVLVKRTQSEFAAIVPSETIPPAGVFTTRAAAKAFFTLGTNRAMFRFTMLNHLCNDMEQVKDITYPTDRIRQDVSRSPGGDSTIFMTGCVGCHNGMDPMTQAFAHYDFVTTGTDSDGEPNFEVGNLSYSAAVQPKYLINMNNFEDGYVTTDDRWTNYWRAGSNSSLGWANNTNGIATPGNGEGNGAASMGQELANSEAFAQCQVEKVFKAVCLREPLEATDQAQVTTMVGAFKSAGLEGYSLKQVFADSAVYCKGI